ncbi:helix-turn-helix transcriptional regulator [Thalassobacillus pellis]|uniref:helix-turn-helix transcriptional regulator n=1 Tax=Thalassobacillus pellis TaxID=748008 RepID=UPI00196126EA|nr:WYL domain-containing protein [Thalassobacillus pellis]MBM7552113.1 putative DNA-binding transcriptional regulator YafY [Thalassobacillus pellis]
MSKLSTRERVLVLKSLLEKYTDEDNELTLNEIVDLLHDEFDQQYDFNKRLIKDDLLIFEESEVIDLIVNQEMNGKPKYYSYQNRLFEIQELRLLSDAVISARFITKSEKAKLIDKIKQLTSMHLAEKLENQIHMDNETSHSQSNMVKYIIYDLHNAINDRKAIQFQYGRYNIHKEFLLSRGGKVYGLHPYALVWNRDYYYLIGWSREHEELRHFRVDRMVKLNVTDEKFVQKEDFDISKYTHQLFHMFTGKEQWIEIKFADKLINVIIDRFGKNIPIKAGDDGYFSIKTKAVISDGLVGWLLTWGESAEVLAPEELRERMKQEAEKIYHLYH